MFRRTKTMTDIQLLVRQQKVQKKVIAEKMGISPQALSRLLNKGTDGLSINQLQEIMNAIGLQIAIYIEDRII
jgi:predicted XRE-type DNA-binding protein